MLDMRFIREHPELVRADLERRRDGEKLGWLQKLLKLDAEQRTLQLEVQKLRADRNRLSEEINQLKKDGSDATEKLSEVKGIPARIAAAEEKAAELAEQITFYRMRLPNIMHESVPYGKDSDDNAEVRRCGEPVKKDFELKLHSDVIERLDGGDFRKAADVAGTGFYYLWGDFALLDQALQQFAIDMLVKKGYKLVEPPLMLRRKAYEGVTDLADFETMMYKIDSEDLYLIATSEHPICALLMNETIDVAKLPLRLAGTSPCFRKEIGSHGVDERGLFRVHQFNKIEQFIFCRPEDSWKLHEELIRNAEDIYQALGLPYRIVNICTGDLGIVAAKKYDLELWFPREQEYKEAVSCSNCTAYQAVRLNIRFKKGNDKGYLHTLNSTAIATGRTMRAIIENFQNKDGSVTVPAALKPYMKGRMLIS